jgi:hypothetical protein
MCPVTKKAPKHLTSLETDSTQGGRGHVGRARPDFAFRNLGLVLGHDRLASLVFGSATGKTGAPDR